MTISEAIKNIGFVPRSVRCLTNGHIAVGFHGGVFMILDANLNVVWEGEAKDTIRSIHEMLGRLLVGMDDGLAMSLWS